MSSTLTLNTMLASYEGVYMKYMLLLDTVGDICGNFRIIPGYDMSTNHLLSSITNTNTNACFSYCTTNTSCIGSVFDSSTNKCTLYGAPTPNDNFFYKANRKKTTYIDNQDYYVYMLAVLNKNLQTYITEIKNYIQTHDQALASKFPEIQALTSSLSSQQDQLISDEEKIASLTTESQSLTNDYNDSYYSTVSTDYFRNVWIVVALISVVLAFMLCYTIIKE
jgi:PAN domain